MPFWFRIVHGVVDSLVGALIFISIIQILSDWLNLSPQTGSALANWSVIPNIILYRYGMIMFVGGTFAHGLTSCRVQTTNGGPVNSSQAWSRAWRSLIPWDIFTYKDGTFAHDRGSGTKLVRVPRPKVKLEDRWLT